MQAGTCAGVTGIGDCVNTGWTPQWLPPLAFSAQVDSLLASTSEIVCPYCVLERAEASRIPGFNKNKYNRLRAMLDAFYCMQVGGSQSTSHTHLFDFQNEDMTSARPHDQPPGQDERGY